MAMEDEMLEVTPQEESEAGRLLAAASATIPVGTGLLEGARRRRAARRRRRRIALGAGSAALAAVAVAGTLVSVTVAEAPSALAVVTAAASHLTTTSYHVRVVTEASPADGGRRVAGEFDPARRVGQETVTGRNYAWEIRDIGDVVYLAQQYGQAKLPGHAERWTKGRTLNTSIPPGENPDLARLEDRFSGVQPASPEDLLTLLRSATSVHAEGPASGPGWTGTRYSFSATQSRGFVMRVTGTVAVDQQGRLRTLDATRVYRPQTIQVTTEGHPSRAEVILGYSTVDHMTFSDFGAPVSVSAPPASQVVDGSYWSLVFLPS
jgi:hypothetical protein